MILVDRKMVFTDCYAETMSTQMGLLKSIKYSTFEVSALNEIVDENGLLKGDNEHLGADFARTFGLRLGQASIDR